jgi:hypothetical protein
MKSTTHHPRVLAPVQQIAGYRTPAEHASPSTERILVIGGGERMM